MSSFAGRAAPMNGPATGMAAVTPNDAADLPDGVARSLFVGAAGALRLADPAGRIVTLTSGAAQYHPVMVARIFAEGTTATGIVALY
jgi:hypothetical protein